MFGDIQDPHSVPVVNVSFYGWSGVEGLFRKKIKIKLVEVIGSFRYLFIMVVCQPLRDCNTEGKLSRPQGLSISFNHYNNLGGRCYYYSHIRLRYVQCLAHVYRASKSMY